MLNFFLEQNNSNIECIGVEANQAFVCAASQKYG